MAELANCIALDFEHDVSEGELAELNSIVGSTIFRNFIERQIKSAENQIKQLNPHKKGMTAEIYYNLAKDLRLLVRFWADFSAFAEGCHTQAEIIGDENE